jgi:23S rRNA U2552 (ribose-2'-O)-methylase RlmE/FtsJ
MWEILNKFNIILDNPVSEINNELVCKSLHLAEAPGAFIQAFQLYNSKFKNKILKQMNDHNPGSRDSNWIYNRYKWYYHTISLRNSSIRYNNAILKPNVSIDYGEDNTGNLHNLKNIDYFIKKTGKFHVITSDAGFNEQNQYTKKEMLHYTLIRDSIITSIYLLKQDGMFILKVFNFNDILTIRLVYVLFKLFKQVFIYKPKTSRPTNSEKYIVCKFFNYESLCDQMTYLDFKIFIMTCPIDQSFFVYMKKLNTQYELLQIKYISNALEYDIIHQRRQANQFNSWCKEFNLVM